MAESKQQNKKIPVSIGLLAHVGAGRREPRKSSYIPGSKTGDFLCPAKANDHYSTFSIR